MTKDELFDHPRLRSGHKEREERGWFLGKDEMPASFLTGGWLDFERHGLRLSARVGMRVAKL